jgi:hypothetical protein
MAQKSSGKSQGRSRPQAQSKNQGRASQQNQNADSGRAGRGGGQGAANGTASSAKSGGSQQKGRATGRQGPKNQEREQSQQAGSGGKVGDTLKQHPITAAALGAGLTLLAAQGLRMAIGARNPSGEENDGTSPESSQSEEGQDEGYEEDEDARDASASGEEGEEEEGEEGDEGEGGSGGGLSGRLRNGASSLGRIGSKFGQAFRGSGDAIKRGAKSGFDRGREGAGQSWTNHPLFVCGVALAVGTAAGFLLPPTRQEDQLMGETSDKLAGRFKKGGKEAFRQGRAVAGRVLHEAVSASARETEREGLTPDRLGKKFKRVFTNVRDAVAEAVQED